MSEIFQCGDNTALVGYLYGECDPAERQAIAAHVEVCAACAAELAALGSTRLHLASWTPPEAELGFQISRAQGLGPRAHDPGVSALGPGTSAPGPRPWYRAPLPAWAQAAAAFLIFAAGLWLGVERGSAPAPATQAAVAATGATAPANAATSSDLAALEQRLRAEMAQIRDASTTPVGAPSSPTQPAALSSVSEAQVLARVRALIDESEQRQQRELAFRVGQVGRDFDIQRRADLATIQRTFGQMEGQTGAEVRDQREMLNYLMRVSQQQGR